MENRRLLVFKKPRTGELLSFKTKHYYVHPDGMVWSEERKRFLKQREMNNGYMAVCLTDDNGKKHTGIMVHNLVATSFIRLLERGENVHHRDSKSKNNNLDNLEIISASEHSRIHDFEKWASGTMNGVGEKVKNAWAYGAHEGHAEKMRKAWADGRMKNKKKQVAVTVTSQPAQLQFNFS